MKRGISLNKPSLELNEEAELPRVADEENEPLTKMKDGRNLMMEDTQKTLGGENVCLIEAEAEQKKTEHMKEQLTISFGDKLVKVK